MITFGSLTYLLEHLGLDYEWMDGMMVVQSRCVEKLEALHSWLDEHCVFVTDIDSVPDMPGLFEVQIDTQF